MSNDQPPFDEAATGHLSMDEIADLGEGLLTDEQASAARDHLAGCVECSDRASALDATTSALKGLGPVAMPADVAARIDAALAAEASGSDAKADKVTASNVTVMPDPSAIPRQRFRLPTAPAAAAAVVIVLAVVAIVVGHNHHHSNNGISIEQAGPAKPPLVGTAPGHTGSVTPVSTGRVYDASNLASYVPALLTSAEPSVAPTSTTTLGTQQNAAGSTTDSTSVNGSANVPAGSGSAGGKATHKTVKKGKHRNAANTVTAPAAAPQAATALTYSASVPTVLAHLYSDHSALLQCAATASDTVGAVPLAADFGRWRSPTAKHGTPPVPAIIFVFADVQDSSLVDVYVVSADCGSNSVLRAQFGVAK